MRNWINTGRGSFLLWLEPHKREWRETEKYKLYRDSGELNDLYPLDEPVSTIRTADSFQIAVANNLTALAHQGRANPLPKEKSKWTEYFRKEIELRKDRFDESLVIYFCSLGLLSSGELDALPLVLDHMPLTEGTGWGEPLWGAAFLRALVPCNFYFDPIDEAKELKNWYQENNELFRWNETRGAFERT